MSGVPLSRVLVWDEDWLLAEVDRMEDLLADRVMDDSVSAFRVGLAEVRDFIETREQVLLSEIERGPPEWDGDLRAYPCLVQIGSAEATFETTWGSIDGDWWTEGTADFRVDLWGTEYPVSATGAAAGESDGRALVLVAGTISSDTSVFPYFLLREEDMVPGAVLEIDWWDVDGYLAYSSPDVEWAMAAYLYQGTLTLDQAGTNRGDIVSGHFSVGAWGGQ